MELRNLEHFLAVAETGSFTRAAARVHVVQSALSVSVRSLETELGTRLFDRTTRRVDLTDAGRALVSEARNALAAVESARDAVAAVAGGTRGTVRIGIMHSMPGVDLTAFITAFRRERPQARIALSTHPDGSAGLAAAVADNELDIAFAAVGDQRRKDLRLLTLAAEPIRLACPPGHHLAGRKAVRLAEIAGEPFIDVPPSWGSRMSIDRLFAEHDLRRHIIVEVGDVATVIQLVQAGLGVALVAPSSAPPDAGTRFISVRPHPTFEVSMVTARARTLPATARAFADLVHRDVQLSRLGA